MKREIKLFFDFDFEFTSLSPSAQPVSLGIVSEVSPVLSTSQLEENKKAISNGGIRGYHKLPADYSKSFYAEFSDFDLSRCDNWVKLNVVGKLKYILSNYHAETVIVPLEDLPNCPSVLVNIANGAECLGSTNQIKTWLKDWLSQFLEYNIQFVCDCGTFDWYWMLQLLDERPSSPVTFLIPDECIPPEYTIAEFIEEFKKSGTGIIAKGKVEPQIFQTCQFGTPRIPENISPVPLDLNDLIAFKKGISIREAFELDRDLIFLNRDIELPNEYQKHNALWDAKVIKAWFEILQ